MVISGGTATLLGPITGRRPGRGHEERGQRLHRAVELRAGRDLRGHRGVHARGAGAGLGAAGAVGGDAVAGRPRPARPPGLTGAGPAPIIASLNGDSSPRRGGRPARRRSGRQRGRSPPAKVVDPAARGPARLCAPHAHVPRRPVHGRLSVLLRHLHEPARQDGRRPRPLGRHGQLRRAVPRRGVPAHGVEQRRLHRGRRRAEVRVRADDGADPRPGAALQQLLPRAPVRAVGGAGRHRVAQLALDLRRPERLPEQLPDHLSPEQQHHLLAVRPRAGHGLRHRRRRVGRHAALLDDLPGRAAGHPPGAVRGGRDRRGLRRPAVLLRDGAAPAGRSSSPP